MKAALAASLLLAAGPAPAADRTFSVTSFDRIRVDGPYQVTLSTNVAPFARATGSRRLRRAIDSTAQRTQLLTTRDLRFAAGTCSIALRVSTTRRACCANWP